MADDERLKPQDFPVHTEQKKTVGKDGKTIAEGSDKKIAEDVAERLNAEEDLREEDRWSVTSPRESSWLIAERRIPMAGNSAGTRQVETCRALSSLPGALGLRQGPPVIGQIPA